MKRKLKKIIPFLLIPFLVGCSEPVQGPKGEQGDQGAKGPVGDQGAKGETGPQGDQGPVGSKGVDGLPGFDGNKGATGDKGATGEKGPVGEKGPTGDQGATGAKGETGDAGEKGETGPDGEDGTLAISDDGYFIINGEKTEVSATGTPGPQGPQGQQGDKGETGDDGVSGAYYQVTFYDMPGGYVDTQQSDYIIGEDVVLTAHAYSGYTAFSIMVNNVSTVFTSGTTSCTVKMVEGGLLVCGIFVEESK